MNYSINHLAPFRVSAIVRGEIIRSEMLFLFIYRLFDVGWNMGNFLFHVTVVFILFLGQADF